MTTKYKQQDDIPDLYNILGLTIDICKEPNCDELLQKAYIRKAKICHPDKHPGRKDAEEVFELLTSAYDILKDNDQRLAYNNKLTLNKQSSSDFFKLKKNTIDYAQTMGEYKPPTDQQKLSFKEQMGILDAKHGFDPSTIAEPILERDTKKKLNELAKTRTEQDIKLLPEKIFENDRFDLQKFNAAFDMVHKREDNSIVSHNGVPSAWNDFGAVTNYSTFDNLDNLYVDDNNRYDTSRQTYGSIDFGAPMPKITKDDIHDIQGANYVYGHNVLDEDYYKEMKNKLRDRDGAAKQFEEMSYTDFKRDDTAGYGIFDQLGFKFDDRISLDIEEDDISKKFEKLMLEKQKKLPSDKIKKISKHQTKISR